MIQLQFLPNLSHTHHPTRHCATINDLQSLRRTMLFKPAWLCTSSLCPSPPFTGWASPCLSSHVSSSMKILPAPHPTRWPCPLSSVLITLYYNMLSPRPGLLHRVAQVESRDKGPWSRWQEGLEIHPVLHLPIGGALVPSCLHQEGGMTSSNSHMAPYGLIFCLFYQMWGPWGRNQVSFIFMFSSASIVPVTVQCSMKCLLNG